MSSISPRISFCMTKCRMAPREKPVQAVQGQPSSSGSVRQGVLRVAQVQPPVAREGRPHARRPRGKHAVEDVHPAGDHLHDALRVADAHEVAEPVLPAAATAVSAVVSSMASRSSPTVRPPMA